MMHRKAFEFSDIAQECQLEQHCYTLDNKRLGLKITVPPELYQQHPFNASAYAFLQYLRPQIAEFGIIEFAHLPLNKTNYTLAQRAPKEHLYSSNNYLTDLCQQPHQDTPPYPTAFWLDAPRQYFATWVMSRTGVNTFIEFQRKNPQLSIEEIHQQLVPASLARQTGILLNQTPGLLLIDNSEQQSLYHARTCNFEAINKTPSYPSDNPMYAFNEVGLLNYIDILDSQRGNEYKDVHDLEDVKTFLAQERL
jgi:hypothetical protein